MGRIPREALEDDRVRSRHCGCDHYADHVLLAPSYQSTATLIVQPLTIDQPLAFSSTSEMMARNVAELVKSASVQQRAAKSLGQAKLEGTFDYRLIESSGLIKITDVADSPKKAAAEANAWPTRTWLSRRTR